MCPHDRTLFDAVQAKLDQQRSNHTKARNASDALLMGRIFDDRGNRMTPTHALKNGVRYRYYVSSTLVQGEKSKAGQVSRVPADQVERLVIEAVRQRIDAACTQVKDFGANKSSGGAGADLSNDRILIRSHVRRVDVGHNLLQVQMTLAAATLEQQTKSENNDGHHDDNSAPAGRGRIVLRIPWAKRPAKAPRQIIAPSSTSPHLDHRPIRAETRAKLIAAIAQGRR